jgi:CPA1 family monovalent cation:H+ antiporter
VGDDGTTAREESEARNRMSEVALEKMEEHRRNKKYPESALDSVEQIYRERALNLHDNLVDQLGWSEHRHHQLSVRRLRRAMIVTQRHAIVEMRRSGVIGDDVLHKIEHELDLEEARYKILT